MATDDLSTHRPESKTTSVFLQQTFPEPVQAAVEANLAVVPADLSKRPKVPWRQWQTEPQTSEDLAQLGHGSLWAVVTGEQAGFVVLDFDGPEGLSTMERLGLDPHVRTATGAHVYVRHPGHPVKSSAKQFDDFPGLDIKGDKSLAYFSGRSKKGTYQPVQWPPAPVDLPPQVAGRLFPLPSPEAPSAPAGTWEGPGDGVPEALDYLARSCRRIEQAPRGTSNHELNSAGYSVGGLVAAGQLDPAAAFERLLSAARTRGAGDPETVLRSAMESGAGRPWTLDTNDDPEWELVLGLGLSEVGQRSEGDDGDLESRTIGVGDLFRRRPPRWLVPGFLQAGALAELVGPPSAGKSLLALQWSVDLARDGKRVLYAAAEGMGGFGPRLRALARHKGLSPDELEGSLGGVPGRLRFYTRTVDLGSEIAADDLVSWVEANGPWDLIVIDTLARAIPGVEENSATEMGAAVHAAERLKAGDGTVLLVHHSGHDTHRGRGSSAVLAACDNVVHCFPVGTNDGREGRPLRVKVSSEKLKDGRASAPVYLELEEVDLGDWDGEPFGSVVLVPFTAEARAEERRAAIEDQVRQKLKEGQPWEQARNSWRGENRRQARAIWERLGVEGARAA